MSAAGGPIAVSGASGFIGSALIASVEDDGHRVLRLVRRPPAPGADEVEWHPEAGRLDQASLEGVAAAVHLAAENIDGRWTGEKKRRIRQSRLQGTSLLAERLASLTRPPEVLVSGSAVGFYGADRAEQRLTEASPPGTDFLGRMGVEWEAAARPAAEAGIRVVHPRFGMVLARHGGALKRMLLPFQLGFGGRLGDGRQWMSWITLVDAVRVLRFVIATPELRGPVNTVAPEPVTNAEFTEQLGRALRRPTLTVVPTFALQLAFGEMAEGTVLASQRVIPEALLGAGFTFEHPRLEAAFASIFRD